MEGTPELGPHHSGTKSLVMCSLCISALRSAAESSSGMAPQPWTAAVAIGSGVSVLFAAYIVWKVARGVSEWIRAYRMLALQKVPRPPILGALEDLGRTDIHKLGIPHEEKLGGLVWVHVLHYHVMMISEPKMVTQLLDRQMYPDSIDKAPLYNMMDQGTASPPCPSVLSTSTKDPFWRRVRKGVAPAFSQSNIQAASESSIAMAYRLADTLGAHGPAEPLDIDAAMQNAAFDVIGVFGFGKDFKATMDLHGEGAQACKCLAKGMEIAVKSKLRPDTNIPFTPAWYEYRDTQTRLLSIFRNLMKEVLARGQPEAGDQTIAAFLRRIRAEDGAPLSELRFWSELSIFFFAGVETTGHTLAFALYYISQHRQVEARLLEELRDLGLLCGGAERPPRMLTPADVQKLAYLHCVIKETQRLMPVVPLLVRAAQKDVRIGDTVVPRGSLMTAHFLAMHTSARYWERPKDFIPERWLDPDCEYARPIDPSSTHVPMGPAGHSGAGSEAKGLNKPVRPSVTADRTQDGTKGAMASDPYAFKGQRVRRYMPYGSGSRECLGMPQARVTMLATLAVMLSRFSFGAADQMGSAEDMRKAEVYRITVSLKDGLWMHCHPRAAGQTTPPAAAR